jgi:restriction system protein
MKNLSKEELIELYETLPEETLKKLGTFGKAKEAYEEKQKAERLKKERIEKAIALVKEAQELLNIYRLALKVSPARGIRVLGDDGNNIKKSTRQNSGRVKRGLKTPNSQYRVPILQVLEDMGGSGNGNVVVEKIHEKVKHILGPVDLEEISSGQVRWENAANWERYRMVQKGLLSKNSPRGIWEITEKGREYLKEHKDG